MITNSDLRGYAMAVTQLSELRAKVIGILKKKAGVLRVPEIEVELKHDGYWDADTFDVRDMVAELIADGTEEVHPGRKVKLANR